jgi:hypothetical protein
MSVQIRKTGFNFAALSRNMRGNIADVLNEGGESFVSLRKQLAPKDTHWMSEQTRVEEEATADRLKVVMVCDSSNNPHRGGNNEAYDALVEYGTVNSDAQPSATPAFESARKQVNNRLLNVLKRAA